MILRSSPPSPFGRKVKIAAMELGLMDGITVEWADTTNPEDNLRAQNPLGKIPVLLLEDGTALYDSRVILEYLDHLAGGGKIIPAHPEERFPVLRLQALADGIMDAAILQMYEIRFREKGQLSPRWVEHQQGKVERALVALEASPPAVDAPLSVGTIALACALGYLDLRFDGIWRESHPTLTAWLTAFSAAYASFEATRCTA